MSNPLLSFIGLVDQYGTNIADMGLSFKNKILEGTFAWDASASLLATFMLMIAGYSLYGLGLLDGDSPIFSGVASGYQVLLDSVYAYINPLVVAMFAAVILIGRVYFGDKLTKDKEGKILGLETRKTWITDDLQNDAMRKALFKQAGNAAILLGLVGILMANPFLLINRVFEGIRFLANPFASKGTGATANVDGLIVPVLQLINYKETLAPECSAQWSATLASGGDVSKLSCLTAAQKAGVTPDAVTPVLAFFAIIMVIGLGYFAWQMFRRGSWILARTLYFAAIIPWRAALLIANPGDDRSKLASIKDAFMDVIKNMLWLVVVVFLATFGTTGIMAVGQAIGAEGIPMPVMLLICSAFYYLAGEGVRRYLGYETKIDPKTKKRVRITDDGTSGWRDFAENNQRFKTWAADPWSKAVADAGTGTGGGGGRKSQAGKEEAVTGVGAVTAEEAAAVDIATATVNLEPKDDHKVVIPAVAGAVAGAAAAAVAGAPKESAGGEANVEKVAVLAGPGDSDPPEAMVHLAADGPTPRPDGGGGRHALVESGESMLVPVAPMMGGVSAAVSVAAQEGPGRGAGAELELEDLLISPTEPSDRSASVVGPMAGQEMALESRSEIVRDYREVMVHEHRSASEGINGDDQLTSIDMVVNNSWTSNIHNPVAAVALERVRVEREAGLGSSVDSASDLAATSDAMSRSGRPQGPGSGHTGVAGDGARGAGEALAQGSQDEAGFVAAARRVANQRELGIMARTLGVNPEFEPERRTDGTSRVIFNSSNAAGENQLRRAGQDGFGDTI